MNNYGIEAACMFAECRRSYKGGEGIWGGFLNDRNEFSISMLMVSKNIWSTLKTF